MASRRGAFVVIEGTDGSGKGTQFQLLKDRLVAAGYPVEAFDFPRYSEPSSHFVKQYLNGAYGKADEVGPYTASLFFALDRYETAARIRTALDEGKVVLSNRFTGSSMAHQGTKFQNPEERRGYFIWLDNLEFEMLRIPRPDASFVLRVPADIAAELVSQKGERDYLADGKKADIHEADRSHQERAVTVYDDLVQLFPKDFQRIDCVRGGKLLSVEAVHSMIWERTLPLLPQPSQIEMGMPQAQPAAPASLAATASEPLSQVPEITPEDEAALAAASNDPAAAVTNPAGPVYAFTSLLDPSVVAAVVASLGQGGGELSIRVLQEFASAAQKDTNVLRHTVNYYGDESVRQLVNTHVVIAGASGLLADTLEENRMAAYVEPRVRHLRYEQKDSNGLYRYHLPADINEQTAIQYRTHMDRIFDLYAAMLPRLAAHMQQNSGVPPQGQSNDWQLAMEYEARETLQAVLPLAATTTVAVYASAQTFENMFARLASSELPEARLAGARMHGELAQVIPAFLDASTDITADDNRLIYRQEIREATRKLAAEHLAATHAAESSPVRLLHVWPRNELDLVPDMLYEHTSLPLAAIQTEVSNWPYNRKLDAFEAYVGARGSRRIKPGRALEKARYTWDMVCAYHILHDMKRHRITDMPVRQQLTPRYGYEVPAAIEAAGLADEFEACFDTSLALYSLLQQAGHQDAAAYATLRGHKQRWQITYNAREAFHIHELHNIPSTNPVLRAFVGTMHAQLAEVHPLLGESMSFAGNGPSS